VATALQGELPLFLSGLGTVTPTNNVLVKSLVDGQLLRVHFQEGQLVHAGDLLAEIDPRPFQVQLLQAEGQLARDAALLKNAQLDLERYRTLWSQDSIAKQQVDAQEALVRQYEGTVQVDRAQVENAKLQLVYAKVAAPITGRVGLRQVDPGNIVHASDANGIVLITQIQPVNVIFTLPEDNLPRVAQKLTAKVPLAIDAYDRQQKIKLASGMLLTADNQIDTATGTVKLKAQFRNDDSALFPNQFVNIRMRVDTLQGVVMVPVNAVQHGAQNNFVYLLNADNTVKIQNVSVGDSEGDRVVITAGLDAGAQVVIEGLDKLRDGGEVEVVSRDGQMLSRDDSSAQDKAAETKPKRRKQTGGAL
jgi:multidrug efflux system membrane fusion protein